MKEKLGIIQARGGGDVLITLPIAKFYHDRGFEIHWIIDKSYYDAFVYAAPYVNFHSIFAEEKDINGIIHSPYWYEQPKQMLQSIGVNNILSFPYEECIHTNEINLENRFEDPLSAKARNLKFARCNTFDRFKYVVASVPFLEKWNLNIRRNTQRETDLYNKVVNQTKRLIVTNLSGGMNTFNIDMDVREFSKHINMEEAQIVEISKMTDNPLDWLKVLYFSDCFVGVDSFFVNLIDQMKIPIPHKYFIRRSNLEHTPVLGAHWEYIAINLPIDEPYRLQF